MLGLFVGLVVGFWGANYLNKSESTAEQSTLTNTTNQEGPAPPLSPDQTGMLADVQATLDEAEKNPTDVKAQIKAGDMYLQIQRLDDALGFYQKAVDLDPKSFEGNANIGKVYFEKKQFSKAGEYYEKALEINTKDVGLRSDLGLTFYLREPADVKRAIVEYKAALEMDPVHEPALQNLSVALSELRDTEELPAVLERLKKVNPNNAALKKLSIN